MSSQAPRRRRERPATTGILVVDKPVGPSSMQVVATVRRRAGGAKTGHAGTLDPLASGVLVVALGKATKIIERLMATRKGYRTIVDLSAFTATDDEEGEREPVDVAQPPSADDVRAALERFTGAFEQRPPAFSAMKVEGRRAYKLARGGDAPEIPPRPVVVHRMDLVSYEWPLVEIQLACGKGFYVRSLARELGDALGTGGYCRSIRRTAVGPFTLETAVPLDEVPEPLGEEALMSIEEALHALQS